MSYVDHIAQELPPGFFRGEAAAIAPAPEETFDPRLPDREPEQRRERRAQLEPTTARLVDAVAAAGVPDYTLHIWIRPLEIVGAQPGQLFVAAPDHIRTAVTERYGGLLEQAAAALAGQHLEVTIVPLEPFDR